MSRQRYTKLPINDLLVRYQAGESSFSSISVRGNIDESTLEEGVDLRGITVVDSSIRNLQLDDANLSGANLTGTSFRMTDLNRVNMSNAVLDRALFSDCVMCEALLTGASIENATFGDTPLEGTIAIGTNFYQSTFVESTDMGRIVLTDACLRKVTAIRAIFYGGVLVGTDLTGANIVNSDLRFADLTDAIFDEDTNDWHCLYCQTIMPDGTVLNDHCGLDLPGDDARRRALQQARSQEI